MIYKPIPKLNKTQSFLPWLYTACIYPVSSGTRRGLCNHLHRKMIPNKQIVLWDCWLWCSFSECCCLSFWLFEVVITLAQSRSACFRHAVEHGVVQQWMGPEPVSLPACFYCCWDSDQGMWDDRSYQHPWLGGTATHFSRISLQLLAWVFLSSRSFHLAFRWNM